MEETATSRAASEEELDAVTDILTTAFAEDPVWGGWAFPDRERAAENRRKWVRFYVKGALRYPWVRVTEHDEAAALWIPPGGTDLSKEDEEREVSLFKEWFGEHAGVHLEALELFHAAHPREVPHYYLGLLGTRVDHRGKGWGMALLKENLALIDAERMPAYLESTNPVNLPKYEQLGFAKVGEFTFSGGGPTVETMWRDPRTG